MKKLTGRSVLKLAAVIATLAAQPASALAQVTCTSGFSGIGIAKRLECRTSIDEHALGSAINDSSSQSTMIVNFFGGQEGAQGSLLKSSGALHCLGAVTRSAETTLCPAGGAKLRLRVN